VAIRAELLIVVGTSSSLAAMPRLMEALEKAGCAAPLVRLLVPLGYCFNLCGSNIYMTMALLFLAQMAHLEMGWAQYLMILAASMLTSKGASGIAGSSFVALGAMLAVAPGIPASSLLFIFGIERLLKCRSLANVIGNGVACIALCAWMGRLDRVRLDQWLFQGPAK
jgi:aerobic C4-dicarboxylate transport protein